MLNTIVDADGFSKPWAMAPFAVPGLGGLWLRGTPRPAFRALLRAIGIADQGQVGDDELDAHHRLLLGDDRGAAFLQDHARRSRPTAAKQATAPPGARLDDRLPRAGAVGRAKDTALHAGRPRALPRPAPPGCRRATVPGKHFLQEDCAPAIAHAVARLAATARPAA